MKYQADLGSSSAPNRELNPELFGENAKRSRFVENSVATAPADGLLPLESKIAETRVQLGELSDTLGNIVNQVNEFIKTSHQKFEKLHQGVHSLEKNDHTLNALIEQKISAILNQMGERKTMEMKMQEVVDRHNGVLRGFETRFNQMQKIMNEKEAQIIQAQAALNDAKMEIARLKRF